MDDELKSARADLQSRSRTRRRSGVKTVEALAKGGDPTAIYAVATWYLHGFHGYKRDMDQAKRFLEDSASALVPEALFDLGVWTERNDKSKFRRRKAFGYYLLAALLGDIDGAIEVRRCLYWGIGTMRNREASQLLAEYIAKQNQPDRRIDAPHPRRPRDG